MDIINQIIDFEAGCLSPYEQCEFIGHLVKTGTINGLQGSYQRTANAMIESGFLNPDGSLTAEAFNLVYEDF